MAEQLVKTPTGEERDFWLEAAEQKGVVMNNAGFYEANAENVIELMRAARQQGREDVLGTYEAQAAPEVHKFHINPEGGPDITVEGNTWFIHAPEFERYKEWALLRDLQAARWKSLAQWAGVCETCALGAPDTFGCTDCLNTGMEQGVSSLCQMKAERDEALAALKTITSSIARWGNSFSSCSVIDACNLAATTVLLKHGHNLAAAWTTDEAFIIAKALEFDFIQHDQEHLLARRRDVVRLVLAAWRQGTINAEPVKS